ncbi:MAG: riboflavin biosynthesis protein RibF [Omnitrophica WOR_2 bacterium GWB2_45_9]|nr:MAG: riboflavin biosynthesis protein RibF [Omnitrophica WOR_2 bacterium GWB2_45_9]OGX48898.1 MAG: riboflavin biosynthesis protein RibF [Omnitrophica WOR_2 bacterium RIFOXYA2_FULL_45_12]HBU07667.1 bifunctional riboflavin kinase/FAD synthetase [Candidatus Omnitrophota bacterium]
MKTIFGPRKLREAFEKTVVLIGVFDGLHRGHRYLIRKAVSLSRARNKKSVCVTFHPHPKKQPCLISLTHRLRLIEELGVDYCLVIKFNRRFSLVTAEDFVKDILVKFFHPEFIFIGENFRFGYQARGTVEVLKALSGIFGFKVRAIKELSAEDKKISSRAIRHLIKAGELKEAQRLLGRRVSVLGTVISGAKRGRGLGYPTANINPHHEVLPASGVYAVKIFYREKEYRGICNIGTRPTFDNPEDNQTIEAHLFNFKKNIYGQDLEIQFIRKIRDEKKFPGHSSLVEQIKKDHHKALRILRNIR